MRLKKGGTAEDPILEMAKLVAREKVGEGANSALVRLIVTFLTWRPIAVPKLPMTSSDTSQIQMYRHSLATISGSSLHICHKSIDLRHCALAICNPLVHPWVRDYFRGLVIYMVGQSFATAIRQSSYNNSLFLASGIESRHA